MGRPARPWKRAGRKGWWVKLGGKQIPLGETKAEADRAFHRLMAENGKPDTRSPSRITVAEVVDLYLENAHDSVEEATYKNYRDYGQSLVDFCGKTPAKDIKPRHITAWLKAHKISPATRKDGGKLTPMTSLGYTGWGPSSQHLAVTVAKGAFRWAKRQGWIDANPLEDAKAPESGTREPVKWSDADRLNEGVIAGQFQHILDFLLQTGCRPGEARTLLASRIDWEQGVALVKGKSGLRPVVLSGKTLALLRGLVAGNGPGDFVFLNTLGKPWSPAALRGQFRRSRKRAGTGAIVPYHCRGIFVSRAIANGVDSAKAAVMIGHSDVKSLATMVKHYLHFDDQTLKEAAEVAIRKPGVTEGRRDEVSSSDETERPRPGKNRRKP